MKKNTEKTTMLIKTDKATKTKAQKVAQELGVPLGTIVSAYLREIARNKSIHFSIPNVQTKKAIQNAKEGKHITTYASADELFEDVLGNKTE